MTRKSNSISLIAVCAGALMLGACSSGGGSDDSETVTVGVVAPVTGPVASYTESWLAGLEAGLKCETDGTNEVDGVNVELEVVDDGGDATKTASAATQLIGDGVTVLTGTVTSDAALQMATVAAQNQVLFINGAAATDAVTGVNKYTFRAGRQTSQDVRAAASTLDSVEGSKVVVLAQDSAYGKSNIDAVTAVLGGDGADVQSVAVPAGANEFTPFVQQVKNANPDLVYVAWAGDDASAVFQAVQQQDLGASAPIVTLLNNRASYGGFGEDPSSLTFGAHFFQGAGDTEEYACLAEEIGEENIDLTSADGYVSAQMILRAVSEGDSSDVDSMIKALEGWTFTSPKGESEVRAEDHALIQPMYTARLNNEGGNFVPELLTVVDGADAAPAPVSMK